MSTTTPNFDLILFTGGDKVNYGDFNNNFTIIDTNLKTLADKTYRYMQNASLSSPGSDTDPNWSYIKFNNGFAICYMTIKLNTGTSMKWGSTDLWKSADLTISKAYPVTFKFPPVVNIEWGETANSKNSLSGMPFTLPSGTRNLKTNFPNIRVLFAAQQSNKDIVLGVSAIGVVA